MADILHIMCERDVGLFSLVQQVVAQVPWAVGERRVPMAFFQHRCVYFTPSGYAGATNVWEYYFEPVVASHPASVISPETEAALQANFPDPMSPGHWLDEATWVSSHFGDHSSLAGKTLPTPYLWDDPGPTLRRRAAAIIAEHVRPRAYIREKVEGFFARHMSGRHVIGVHVRGTDATSSHENRAHRLGSLVLPAYEKAIGQLLLAKPDARVFVATDAQASLAFLRDRFGERVLSYESLRHESGAAAAPGPDGWIMPAYIAGDRDKAARNGEEAVIEYLLLGRCQHLVHNGSGLARTVLLAAPDLPHTNTHNRNRNAARLQSAWLQTGGRVWRGLRRLVSGTSGRSGAR